MLVDQLAHRDLVDVADDDQRGVVGLVVGVVEALAVGGRDLLEILDRADGRPVVRVLDVGERAELLDRLADRIVVDAQPLLFLDHAPFGVDRRWEQLQLAHALGLQLQREADVRGRHGVVVRGQVLGRERVDLAADLLEQAGVLLGRDVLRALEHHVLEHVGDAADADVLVLGSDVIENLHGRDRRLVIRQEQHVQAVRERPVLDVQLRRRQRRGGRGRGVRGLGRGVGGLRGGVGARRHQRRQQQQQVVPSEHGRGNMTSNRRGGNRLLSSFRMLPTLIAISGMLAAATPARARRDGGRRRDRLRHARGRRCCRPQALHARRLLPGCIRRQHRGRWLRARQPGWMPSPDRRGGRLRPPRRDRRRPHWSAKAPPPRRQPTARPIAGAGPEDRRRRSCWFGATVRAGWPRIRRRPTTFSARSTSCPARTSRRQTRPRNRWAPGRSCCRCRRQAGAIGAFRGLTGERRPLVVLHEHPRPARGRASAASQEGFSRGERARAARPDSRWRSCGCA